MNIKYTASRFCQALVLSIAALFIMSCYSGIKRPPPKEISYTLVEKAGWKVGQTYRTLKPGGISIVMKELDLEGYGYAGYIDRVIENPVYKNKFIHGYVPKGTLFQVLRITSSGFPNNFYSVKAKQISGIPPKDEVDITSFGYQDKIFDPEVGSLWRRNPQYLAPVATPNPVSAASSPQN